MADTRPELSVVIPVYNSAAIFPELHRRLTGVLDRCVGSYEVIAVADGCTDNSFDVISRFGASDPRIRAIEMSRNFGHQMAVSAGLAASTGRLVAIIDDDLEDPPEILADFVRKAQEGFDVVYGIRRGRKRSIVHRVMYSLFYRILARMVDVRMPRDSGDLCVMRDRVVQVLNAMPEANRYLRGMRAWAGFRQVGLEYERQPRYAGQPGYTFRQYFRLASNAVLSFSNTPIVLMSRLGALMAAVSFVLGARLVALKWAGRIEHVPGLEAVVIAFAFFSGLQLLAAGILGLYLCRTYDEVKRRPRYVISRRVNLPGGAREE